jgi:two-component system cell cycle sensor histidine kinase/response regulator CckA
VTLKAESRDIRNCWIFSQAVSFTAVLAGCLVLLGWMLGITALTSVLPGLATMKPNTALCFVLAGLSLWLIQIRPGEPGSPRVRRIYAALVVSGIVALMGLPTLAEYLFHLNFGIDAILFHQAQMASGVLHPGQLSGSTALGFLFLGASVLFLGERRPYPAQSLALLTSLNGFVACLGYLLSARSLYDVPAYSSMAVSTAILFALLGIAVIAARPRAGLMAAVTSEYMGGVMVRRILPLVVIVPVAFGWLRWRGQAAGFYGTEFGIALRTLGEVVTFATLVLAIAWWLNRIDRERGEVRRRNYDLASIVACSDDAMLSLDLSARIISWNRGAEELFGYRADEIIGRPIATIVPPDLQEEAKQFLREIRAGRVVMREETARRHKDGSLVYVALTVSPVRDFEGQIVGSSAIAHDISKRKRMEWALRESEQRLTGIIASAMDAIITVDAQQRIILFNTAAEKMFRCSESEVQGQPIELFIPDRFRSAHREHVRRFGETGETSRTMGSLGELWAVRADGAEFQIEASISQIEPGGKKLSTVILRDVAQRKRAEDQLRESEERFRLFAEHAPAALAMFDREMRYLHVSRRWRNDFGLGDRDLLGVSHYEVFPEITKRWKEFHRRGLAGEVLREENERFERTDGSVQWIRWEIRPWHDRTGGIGGIMIFTEDISERKLIEEARERLVAVVESSDDAIIGKNLDGIITSWNTGAEKVFGYSSVEAVGRPILMLLPPERATEEADILSHIRRGERVDHFETVRAKKDGTRIDVSVTISPIRDSSGAIVGASKIARDITERKRAEVLLRESEKNYRTLFESMDEGFCQVEVLFDENDRAVDYLFLEVNPAFVGHTGIPDARGKTMREIAPQHEEHWFETYGKIALTGEPARFENEAAELHRWFDVHAFRVGEPQERKVAIFFDDITERKRAEEAVRRSEEEFRAMANTIPQLVWMANPDGGIFWYNQGWYEYTGTTPQQMEGGGWQSVHDPVALPKVMERWLVSIATGQPFEMTFPLRSAQGEFRAFLTRVAPVKDASGKVVRWFGTNTDVEERNRAEAALREYARVVEGLEEMILVVDRQYRYLIANKAFLNFRGMSAEQVIGRRADEIVGKDVFESSVKERMDECFQGKVVQYEIAFDFPNQGERDLFVSYFPIEGPAGVDRIACVLQDITDRKLAEEALRNSEERFSKAFRNSPLAITISTESEGRYLDVNDAFLQMLGHKRADVIGRTAAELAFWAEPLDRNEMLRQLKENERIAKLDMKYKTATGETREAEVWAESIELDGEPCLLAIVRDVTDVRRLEAQFRQAQKMEAVGRLAGGVAHDFNNILGIILGYSDISLGLDPPGQIVRYLTEIKKASQRAALLTRQLLAFSRQQVVFPKVLDLNDVVKNVTTMFLRLVGEDIEVEFRPGTAIGSMKADPGQIEQILMNLVVNARDAMPNGGKIIIETAQAELDEHYAAQHTGARPGPHVVLVVSDTGCGMDEKTKSQIFEPFFTTKAAGKGTGLGLSTVYGIVKQSEGYVLVNSELGKGTTFKIYFPRVGEKAEDLVSRKDAEPPRGSETILVVEDDKTLRELTVKLLQDAGYQVIEAENAEDALRVMEAFTGGIDLLLTDVVMPGKSGVDLLRQAHVARPNLRSLFMSGYTGDLVALRGVMQEASFQEKPFTRNSLLTKVHSALHTEPSKPQNH